MKKILIASDGFPPNFTGAGLRASRMSNRIHKEYGINFKVICSYDRNLTEKIGGIDVKRMKTVSEKGILFPVYLIQIFLKITRYLIKNRNDIDIIHIFSFSWMNRMIMFSNIMFFKKKTLLEITLNGDDDPESLLSIGKRNRMFKWFTKFLLKKIDRFIVGSKYGIQSFLNVGLDEKKVLVEPRPCDEKEFGSIPFRRKYDLRKKIRLPEKRFIILNVGAVYPRKNQDFLIRCIQLLKNKNVLLVFVGPMLEKNREYISKLKDYIKKNNLEKKVLFTGEQKNVNEYMIASDLFVFASKKEGFPNTIVEAITSGLPVISTEFEPLDDFINDKTGIVIKNDHEFNDSISTKFAKAITVIKDNISSYNRQEIRSIGIKKFSAKKIDAQYKQIYEEM